MLIRLHDKRITSSAVEICREVRRVLDACDVYEPPTPLERVLDYRNLTTEEREQLDARRIIPARFKRMLRRLSGRVRGILDLRARHIYVDGNLHRFRRLFLHYHEVAHDVLGWHRSLFVVTPESALQPSVKRLFEAEANYFAAQCQFQLDDMAKWQRGKRLRLRDLPALAGRYGASLNATARQYVAIQDVPVALVLGKPSNVNGHLSVRFYDAIANEKFLNQFPIDTLGAEFIAAQGDARAAVGAQGTVVESETLFIDLRGESRKIEMATLYNRYDTITMLHPRGSSPLSFFARVSKLAG